MEVSYEVEVKKKTDSISIEKFFASENERKKIEEEYKQICCDMFGKLNNSKYKISILDVVLGECPNDQKSINFKFRIEINDHQFYDAVKKGIEDNGFTSEVKSKLQTLAQGLLDHDGNYNDTRKNVESRETRKKREFFELKNKIIHQKTQSIRKALESKVEIAFLMDCTQSMAKRIEEVKNTISNIIEFCGERFYKGIKLAFVGYRDYDDEPVEILNFTSSVDDFKKFVGEVKAEGGGDICEDVFSGLAKVIELKWESRVRILIHIGDAPQHGSRFHYLKKEHDTAFHMNDVDRNGLRIEELIKRLKDLKVVYFFGEISRRSTSKMLEVFNDVSGGDQKFVQPFSMSNGVPQMVNNVVCATFHTLILRTIKYETILNSYIRGHTIKFSAIKKTMETHKDMDVEEIMNGTMKNIKMEQKQARWEEMNSQKAKVIDIDVEKKVNFSKYSFPKTYSPKQVKLSKLPFGKGVERLVYYCCIGETSTANYVAKQLLHKEENRDAFADYEKMVKKQQLASYFAEKFNDKKPEQCKKITYLRASLLQIHQEAGEDLLYAIEKILLREKDFKKFNNNLDYVNTDIPEALATFLHFTFECSDCCYLVTDLQGFEDKEEFVLTDPCIHSELMEFNNEDADGTDFGSTGIESFLKSHICTEICKEMKLPDPNKYLDKNGQLKIRSQHQFYYTS